MSTSLVEPLWLDIDDVTSIHDQQIEIHGGPQGVRDIGLVEGALGRAQNLFLYEGVHDILTLAVRLGVGIAKNHGFVDGNKRTGVAAMLEFLAINGYWLELPNDTWLGETFELVVKDGLEEAQFIDELDPILVELAI